MVDITSIELRVTKHWLFRCGTAGVFVVWALTKVGIPIGYFVNCEVVDG